MKRKKKKILNRVTYEESPWGNDDPVIGKRIKDFLPPPEVMKKAKVRIIHNKNEFSLDLKDDERLERRAAEAGVSQAALISAVLSDFARGKLTPAEK